MPLRPAGHGIRALRAVVKGCGAGRPRTRHASPAGSTEDWFSERRLARPSWRCARMVKTHNQANLYSSPCGQGHPRGTWRLTFLSAALPEAEAELVAGFNVEYSSMGFALFFLGEYANIILMSSLCACLFCGGWLPPTDRLLFFWCPGVFWFALKVCFFLFLFIWCRASFPRYRYDQLMRLGWKVFLPLSLSWLFLTSAICQVI